MTPARHLVIFVEEPSMEAFLASLLPHILVDCEFQIVQFQGKTHLTANLRDRLRAYSKWLPGDWRLVVLIDRDNDDCRALKKRLEDAAAESKLLSRARSGGACWKIVNRVVIEELEAWYFGDWQAVRSAYPRVPATIPQRKPYRYPDEIRGGTWEAFERVMQEHGYFRNGLRKIEAARAIAPHVDPARNRSPSFAAFRDALAEATA